jgi:hypothetical protein
VYRANRAQPAWRQTDGAVDDGTGTARARDGVRAVGIMLRTAREVLRTVLSSEGRERSRRLYAAETEAIVLAHRLQMLRELACLSEYHLGLAGLARREAVTSQPEVQSSAQGVVDQLGTSMQGAIAEYAAAGQTGFRLLPGGTAW